MEILEMKQSVMTWPKMLRELDKGDSVKVHLRHVNSLRNTISRLKYTEPELEFRTSKQTEDEHSFILVTRIG